MTKRNRPTLLRELKDMWLVRQRWDEVIEGIEYPDMVHWLDELGFSRGPKADDGVNEFELWQNRGESIAIIVPTTHNPGMMDRAVSQMLSVMNWEESDD